MLQFFPMCINTSFLGETVMKKKMIENFASKNTHRDFKVFFVFLECQCTFNRIGLKVLIFNERTSISILIMVRHFFLYLI